VPHAIARAAKSGDGLRPTNAMPERSRRLEPRAGRAFQPALGNQALVQLFSPVLGGGNIWGSAGEPIRSDRDRMRRPQVEIGNLPASYRQSSTR